MIAVQSYAIGMDVSLYYCYSLDDSTVPLADISIFVKEAFYKHIC